MLSCPQHRLSSLHLLHHHRRRSHSSTATATATTTLRLSLSSFPTTITCSLPHPHAPNPEQPTGATATTPTTTSVKSPVVRTHNWKSTSVLLHHLQQPTQQEELRYEVLTLPEKANILEMARVSNKQTPQFPGSVSQVTTSLNSHMHTHLRDGDKSEDDDEEMVMRALEIRRKVTAEVFKEAMRRKGKFGITYSTNLVGRLGDFLDFVMIEAAALKRLPEFQSSSFNVRAITVIEDLQVVPLIRWLKHNGLSYPKIAKLICMSKGNVDNIKRLADWLKSIYVKGEFLGVTFMKSGDNILERSNEDLDEIVEYLVSNGVRMEWMGYVMSRCPQLLSYGMEEVKSRVKFYLDMGMNENDFGTMVFDYPGVLGQFTMEEMNRKVNYLKEFGLTTEDVGRLLAFKPQLMGCSIEERWKPLVKYLYYFGISRDGMKRMLTIKPMVFCIDLEQTIVPKVRFLQDIGIRDDAIGNMLVKFPPLLTYSLHKKIRPVVIFLLTKAGVTQRDIGKVIALGPELLGCSIAKKLEISVKYFLSLGIHIRQLGQMIAEFPMLLRYNINLLRPKYRYLRRIMVRPLQDVIEFPRFFSYSLEARIIPRHKVLVENRINFKLRYMLSSTDEEFEKKVKEAVERRRRFESGLLDDTSPDSEVAGDSLEENTSGQPIHEIEVSHGETEIDFSDSQTDTEELNAIVSGVSGSML